MFVNTLEDLKALRAIGVTALQLAEDGRIVHLTMSPLESTPSETTQTVTTDTMREVPPMYAEAFNTLQRKPERKAAG